MSCVLVTGGAGYIGSHAVYAFLDAGYEVVVIDDLSTGVRANLPQDIPFYQGNVGDRALIEQIVGAHRPQGALHFAGSIVVPESVANPSKYYRNNTSRSLELLDTLVANGVRRLLFSSTAAVYGIPERSPVSEAAPLRPINPYGWSKLFFEQQLKDVAAAQGLTYGILRYFNVAGADPKGRTGQSTPRATHLIKVACQVATGKRSAIEVFGVDYPTRDGTCIRDYIHVTDLVDAHVAVYRHMEGSGESAVFNCGNGQGYSVLEVIRTVEGAAGRSLGAINAARRPGDPPELIADPAQLLAALEWRPRLGLGDMVRSALAWERCSDHADPHRKR
jgi:UDP-glucose 4-epimerase